MLHEVKLVFGCDGDYGEITVSPELMLQLLQRPFKDWMNSITWEENVKIRSILSEKDFLCQVHESISHCHNAGFYFALTLAEWVGFRIELEQFGSEVEFVFTTHKTKGHINTNFEDTFEDTIEQLEDVRETINSTINLLKKGCIQGINSRDT